MKDNTFNDKTPILFDSKKDCSGCSACYVVCPSGAVTMKEDEEGFLYPEINSELCIGCHACEDACAFKRDKQKRKDNIPLKDDEYRTLVYAARNTDDKVLENSTSGGVFTAISDRFLEGGNAILCTWYDYSADQAEFHLVKSPSERDDSRGSLYMQSIARDTWLEAVSWLESHKDKKLMFVGVGCQAAAFKLFAEFRHLQDRVIVMDMVCHGSPSPLVWKRYIRYVRGEGVLSDVNFRDKRTGWSKSVGTAKVDGHEVSIHDYRRLYSSCNSLRPCCSECPYTVTERNSDITIGDFWHIENSMPEFMDERGVSLVLVHSEKGGSLFDSAGDKLETRKSNQKDCWQMNLERPTEHAATREAFWTDFRKKDMDYIIKKYCRVSNLTKVKRLVKKTLKI